MGFVPPLYPYFIKTVGLSTGLSSIKMNMICGERSSYGGLLFVYKKMSVCLYGTVAFAVMRWKLISMNITMHRNVIKMFRIVIRIIISSGICIKIDKNERNNLMIDCNTYYVVVLLIIIVYLT